MPNERNLSVEEIMAEIMANATAKATGEPVARAGWSMDEIDELLAENPSAAVPASYPEPEEPVATEEDDEYSFHGEEYNLYLPEEEEEDLPNTAEQDAVAFVDQLMKEQNVKEYHRADYTRTAPLDLDLVEEEPEASPEPPQPQQYFSDASAPAEEYEEPVYAEEEYEEPEYADSPEEFEPEYEEEAYPEEDYQEEDYLEERQPGIFGRLRRSLEDFLQGGMVEEEPEDDYPEEEEPEEVPVQHVTGKETFADADAQQKTRVFPAAGAEASESKSQVLHLQGELSKGVDENPDSPKMIMELADDRTEEDQRYEKRALADKTVGIHPIHNDKIQHQIRQGKVERSGGGMATDKYRERFLRRQQQKLETTAEHEALHQGDAPEPVERPGFLVKKSKFANTADLEPIPTIIAADADLNTFDQTIVAKGNAPTIEHEDVEIDGQIKLVGFDDREAPPEQIDEENAEEVLREKRNQKVAEFRLDPDLGQEPEVEAGPDELEYEDFSTAAPRRSPRISHSSITSDYLDDEYRKTSDKDRIVEGLEHAAKWAGASTIAEGCIMLFALILSIITGGKLDSLGGNAVVVIFINLGLLLISCIFGVRTLQKGVLGFFRGRMNAAGAATLVVFFTLIEELVAAVQSTTGTPSMGLYTAAATLGLFLTSLVRYLSLKRAKGNFDFVTSGTQLYASDLIEDEDDSFEIGRGLLIADPAISYSAKIKKPRRFVESSFADDPADESVSRPTLAILAVSVIAAIIFGILRSSVTAGFNTFMALLAIGVPCFVTLASNVGLYVVDKAFSKKGSAILGHRAVLESAEMNAYAIDSTELFPKESISIIGIKTFHNMRIDDAILYSAALAIEAQNPLSGVFENTILGKRDLLPPVETLAYEERLGLSAWIHGRRVLFGNRDLLINHNVEITDETFEQQYTHNGRKVMYLAIAGKIAAMFVIQYRADRRMRVALRNADRAGITLLVRNTDCNITEDMISHYFKLPNATVKILSPVSGDLFQKYQGEEKKTAGSGLLHNGTLEASLRTIYEARRLYDGIFTNRVMAIVYSVLAVILSVVLIAINGPSYLTDYLVVAFQLLYSLIAVGFPYLQSRHVNK